MDKIETQNSLEESMLSTSTRSSVTTVLESTEKINGEKLNEKLDEVEVEDGEAVIWVDWEPEDVENPLNFPYKRKWLIASAGITFCALVSVSVSSYAIAQGSVIVDFNLEDRKILAVLGITLFTVTFGSAPLILAPLSEVYGRSSIYIISAVIYAIFFIPQALAQNIQTLLVCRFISGIAGSTAVSLVGGTLSDLFERKERGLPMAIFAFSAFGATALGPLTLSYVEQFHGFRIVTWIQFAMASIYAIILFFVSVETRASVLLSRRAARLRLETGNSMYQCKSDAERSSIALMMKTSMGRPIRMLFTEPVLAAVSIYIAFAWSVLYILLQSIALVFGNVYNFSIGESGLVFSAQIIGSLFGLVIDHYCDKRYQMTVERLGPEARLYQAMVGGILLPVGIFIYAWTSFSYIHWIFPCIGISILYCGLYLVYLCVFSYVADSYTLYAASALSTQSFLRNCIGAMWPLFTDAIYSKLGVQGAGSLVGGISVALACIPFILFVYGARLRARSTFMNPKSEQ